MEKYCRVAVVTMAAALCAALLLAPLPGKGQAPEDEKAKAKAAAKAKQNAKNFENNATVITFYDREGRTVGTAGEKALYNATVLSPDRGRVAVIKNDQQAENADLWILDVATGKSIRITTSAKDEFVQTPVWSPDGRQVAYVTIRSGAEGVYRRASNGEGPEELLYKNPGAFLNLTDWSQDGRYLSFAKSDLSGGILYVLPVGGQGEREPVEIFRSELRMFAPRFSPDGRFLSYIVLDEVGRSEIFVRPFDPSGTAPAAGPWQVSQGSRGDASWRRDGKELYYLGLDRAVMVAEVGTSPTFTFTKPKVLFHPPGAVPVFIASISRDGERFLALPPPKGPQLQQITVFDREGKVVSKVGEPGQYSQPAFSPDGTRLAVMRNDLKTGQQDIWTFDIAAGKGTPVTNDQLSKGPPMWSPDGRQLLYVSTRGSYTGVYRRASDGSGSEELLFRYTPGAGLQLSDISPDGKFLACESGGVMLVVPLTGSDPLARKAFEFSREEFDVGVGRFSPDGRFIAYRSNEADPDKFEVYVRPFNTSTGAAGEGKWRVSKDGVAAMLHWRGDGKEFFFRGFNEPGIDSLQVMAVDVSAAPAFQAGTPKLLFKLPGPLNGNLGNISRDGQRFVFAINVTADAPAR